MAEKTQPGTKTSIDMGDDLLHTKTIERIKIRKELAPPEPTAESAEELVVNAKILQGEGLIDEAKKQLRKALIQKPGFVDAEKILKDIQDLEVQQILKGDGKRKRSRFKVNVDPISDDNIDPDKVIANLEEKIGKEDEEMSFFGSDENRKAFIDALTKQVGKSKAQEKIDLAIAFIEMKLYGPAVRLLSLIRIDDDLADIAQTLKAQALVDSTAFFDALMVLDPLVGDPLKTPTEKLEWIYLCARAHEGLKKRKKAAEWYRAVTQIDPQYRDAYERLLRCEKSLSSSSQPSSSS